MFARIRIVSFFTALEAVRGRFFWAALLLIGGAALVGEFANQLALIEGDQIQTALLASIIRLGGAVLLAIYTINGAIREYQDKGTEMLFATPLSRGEYYLGKLAGNMLLAGGLSCGAAAVMFAHAPFDQVAIWTVSLLGEFGIVVAFSLFCALSLGQLPAAIGCVLGFYLLARSMAAMSLMAHHPSTANDSLLHDYLATGFDALAYVLPRLSDFANTDWLVYGTARVDDLIIPGIQMTIYLTLLSGASLFDLYRKNY